MARYNDEHKQQSRQRIVDAAVRRFKTDGIDGSGIATLMKDAGLTNGAFYGHFESKEDLVRIAVGESLRTQREPLAGLEPGLAGLEQFVRLYLSPEHRDDVMGGCPSAALLDEIDRSAEATRGTYTEEVLETIDGLAARLGDVEPVRARIVVLGLFGSMVGTLQLSRAITDQTLADAMLEEGIRNGLAIIQAATQSA